MLCLKQKSAKQKPQQTSVYAYSDLEAKTANFFCQTFIYRT